MRPMVTVLGSLHYDIMVEAPDRPRKGETVVGRSWHPKCGGKGGNQAVAAARAGARVAMIGAVGDDAFGRTLMANLERHGVDTAHVRSAATESGSGMSVAIFDAEGDYGAVIVSGANLALDAADADAADDLAVSSAVLVLQNEVPEAANLAAARRFRRAGARVILNAAPARGLSEALTDTLDILVVNGLEAEALAAGHGVHSLEDALTAARALLRLCPAVVVTAGPYGVACADRGGARLAIAGLEVEVQSTHGAGDAFVGTLAAALARGDPLEAALETANTAAAHLVATPERLRE